MTRADHVTVRGLLAWASPVALVAASLAFAAPAGASEAADAAASASDNSATTVTEVVVTGGKFGSDLKKAPVSAVAVTQEELAKYNIQSASDVAIRVPSLNYTTPFGFAEAYIRGVGTDFELGGLEAPVATYIDGYYIQRQLGAALSLVDLKGVEVLNGPQGTLYGRNATGGAMVYTTADPTSKFGGRGEVEYGSYDQYRALLVVNIPINDQLAVRIVGQQSHVGNYLRGTTGSIDSGESNTSYGRIKVKWTPTPNFSATYSFDLAQSFGEPNVRQIYNNQYCQYCTTAGVDVSKLPFYSHTDGTDVYNKIRYSTHLLSLNYETQNYVVSSVTGYRSETTPIKDTEVDMPGGIFYAAYGESGPNLQNDTYIRTKFDAPLNFLAGVFLMHEHDVARTQLSGLLFDPYDGLYGNKVDIDSQAIYGEVYYTWNKFKLTTGFRWSQDRKHNYGFYDTNTAIDFGLGATGGNYTVSKLFPQFTPRAVVEYNLTDSVMAYASYNRGFRSGGFQAPSPTVSPSVRSETIDSYEIGSKGRYFDGRLSLNIAAFVEKYSNMQVTVSDAQTGTILVKNAASADIQGVEANFDFNVTKELHLSGGASVMDNSFKSFPNAVVYAPYPAAYYSAPSTGPGSNTGLAQIVEDLTGHVLPNSPKFSGNLGVDYTVPVNGWSVRYSLLGTYTSKYEFSVGGGGPLESDFQKAYGKINASVDATMPDGHTTIGLYATNITGAEYRAASHNNASGAWYLAPIPPSVFVRLKHDF